MDDNPVETSVAAGSLPSDSIGIDELLTTTRAVRRQLDLDRPVDLQVVRECLGMALQAPSGGNRQGWRWVVVADEATRAKVAAEYRAAGVPSFRAAVARASSTTERRVYESALYLAENMHRVPVLIVACYSGRPDLSSVHTAAGYFGSIMPAVWNLQLALRSRDLGSSLTTVHLLREAEVADILGIPSDVTQVALLPVGHLLKHRFAPARRQPLAEVSRLDHWSQAFA